MQSLEYVIDRIFLWLVPPALLWKASMREANGRIRYLLFMCITVSDNVRASELTSNQCQ